MGRMVRLAALPDAGFVYQDRVIDLAVSTFDTHREPCKETLLEEQLLATQSGLWRKFRRTGTQAFSEWKNLDRYT